MLTICVVACSGSTPPSLDGGSTGDAGFPPGSQCPGTPPANGAPCTFPAMGILACEWGGDSNGQCTTSADCAETQGQSSPTWIVTTPDPSCGVLNAQCPATFSSLANGAACPASDLTCEYEEGICGCLPCAGDGGFTQAWHCRPYTDVETGCPVPPDRLGTSCSQEGLMCDYHQCCGGPSLGPSMECNHGIWSVYVDTGCSCAERQCD
jgi:hypothetical protein